jgi:phosphatidylglycerol:prolipoprotein diacylglycerol transferase
MGDVLSAKGMHVLATLVCHVLGPLLARRLEGFSPWRVWQVLVGLGAAAYVGGRLHFLLNNPEIFEGHAWDALTWSGGGLHAAGALFAMAVVAWPLARLYGMPLGRLCDALAPTVGLGMAVARVGCWIHGCCAGTVGHWPWCITHPPEASVYQFQLLAGLIPPEAPVSLPAHPLQLYFVGLGLLVFVATLALYRRKHFDGEIALFAATLFSLGSAGLETFRADWTSRTYWGPLPSLLWLALAASLIALPSLAVAEMRYWRQRRGTARVVTR